MRGPCTASLAATLGDRRGVTSLEYSLVAALVALGASAALSGFVARLEPLFQRMVGVAGSIM